MTRERALPAAVGALAVAVVAVGIAVHETRGTLGTATPPFVSTFGVAATPWALAAAALIGAVLAGGPALAGGAARARRAVRHPLAFAAGLLLAALAVGLAVSASRHGTSAWSAIFDTGPGGSFEAKNEYLPALPAAQPGVHYLLDRFALLIPALPANAAAHPPGLLIALHLGGIDTAGGMAALCIAAAAAIAPLTYALARAVLPGQERSARVAGLLAVLSPAVLLFGFTSADAVYAALATAAAALLAARRPVARGAGAALLAVCALFSWALLAIGAWAVVLAWRREGLRAAAVVGGRCAVAVLGLLAVLAATAGYDPIDELRATETIYRHSLAEVRPYWFWALGSPTAWLAMLGLPVAAAWLVGLARLRPAAVALAAIIVVAAVLGFTKAETERIWLPFVPLACVAAADVLPARWTRAALALLGVQALAWELLFATIW
jgi:hypothetical protein